MLRRLWLSLRRDNLINLRNHYYTVTIAVALLYLAAVYLMPDDSSMKQTIFLVDQTAGARAAAAFEGKGPLQVVDTEAALREVMAKNRNSVGILIAPAEPLPTYRLFFQGHESQKVQNLLAASIEDELRKVYGRPWPTPVPVRTEALRPSAGPADLSAGLMLLPFLLFTDACMIGLLFIAALIFMEKEEGTLQAFLVTPGRVPEYLLSKALTLGFLAMLFTVILVAPVMGLEANYLHLLALMLLGSMFGSLAGAWIAVHFESLSQFLFPAIILMAVATLPVMTYLLPSFSPLWVRLFPTYPLIFGLREAIFPSGNPQAVYTALATLLPLNGLLLACASWSFRRQIART